MRKDEELSGFCEIRDTAMPKTSTKVTQPKKKKTSRRKKVFHGVNPVE
ncbi:MAG: hypothetical protein WBE28_01840 [bacterium]